jgi:hypothetical protein
MEYEMKEITTEGMTYFYFPLFEELPDAILSHDSVNTKGLTDSWDNYLSSYSNEFRLALFPSAIVSTNLHLYFLHWLDMRNLVEVDQHVLEGNYTDSMFESIVATIQSRLKCRTCEWEGRGIVMAHSDVYLGFPELEDRKLTSVREKGIKQCPVCNNSLRQTVVRIFQ